MDAAAEKLRVDDEVFDARQEAEHESEWAGVELPHELPERRFHEEHVLEVMLLRLSRSSVGQERVQIAPFERRIVETRHVREHGPKAVRRQKVVDHDMRKGA